VAISYFWHVYLHVLGLYHATLC